MQYIPNTKDVEREILAAIGVERFEDLISNIPQKFLQKCRIDLPEPLSEIEATQKLAGLAERNAQSDNMISFLGGGCYDHFIPAVVDFLISRSEFYTAYTPYQPEVAQGTLQSIYEYQSLICHLLDMEVANASLYDGASALAEAAIMAVNKTHRTKVLVSPLINANSRRVLETYLSARAIEVEYLSAADGVTDFSNLGTILDDQTAALLVQSPNFLGCLEEMNNLAQIVHANDSLLVLSVNPLAAALVKTPGELAADIAVAEGQSLGIHQSFGGPYLGIFTARKELIRNMPGRIVGETVDIDGKRGYVLVLQTREQHIRREKATSNICTNQGLMALAATIYLSLLGKQGLLRVAKLCLKNAHDVAEKISALENFSLTFAGTPFFNEFVVETPVPASEIIEAALERKILAGIDLAKYNSDWDKRILIAVTEKRSQQEIDDFVKFLSKF